MPLINITSTLSDVIIVLSISSATVADTGYYSCMTYPPHSISPQVLVQIAGMMLVNSLMQLLYYIVCSFKGHILQYHILFNHITFNDSVLPLVSHILANHMTPSERHWTWAWFYLVNMSCKRTWLQFFGGFVGEEEATPLEKQSHCFNVRPCFQKSQEAV